MNEINRVLRQAAWRLFLIDLIRKGVFTLSAAVVALIVALLLERILGLAVPWGQAIGVAGALAAAGALAWSLIALRRGLAVARELDERADLRESLSTALCVAGERDGWSEAVVETARQRAASVQVRRAIPLEAPRAWPAPFALALSMAIVWWSLPHWDVLGLFAEREQEEQAEREIVQVKDEVQQAEQKIEDLLAKAKVPEDAAKGTDQADAPEPQTPDEIRRAAIKKLTNVQDRLNELKGGEKSQKFDALKQMMRELKQPGPGPLNELTKAMAKGDFQAAKEKLDELAQQLANGDLSPEQKEQLKEQLQKLSEQLDKLAENRKSLEQKLQQAGMSPEEAKKAAADPEALKQAMEQLKNLTPEQKQQLADMAKAMAEACQQCENMGEAMGKMAKGMGEQGMSQEGMEGMNALRGQLSDAEMLAQEMDAMDAALSETMSQLAKLGGQCEGGNMAGLGQFGEMRISPWRAGETQSQGNGSGSPGRGWGPSPEAEETDIAIEKRSSPMKLGQGPIIGSRLVQGDAIRGEAVTEFSEAVQASSQAASEALETMQIQREYHPAVKHYFGRLEAKTRAAQGGAPAAEPAPAEPADGK